MSTGFDVGFVAGGLLVAVLVGGIAALPGDPAPRPVPAQANPEKIADWHIGQRLALCENCWAACCPWGVP